MTPPALEVAQEAKEADVQWVLLSFTSFFLGRTIPKLGVFFPKHIFMFFPALFGKDHPKRLLVYFFLERLQTTSKFSVLLVFSFQENPAGFHFLNDIVFWMEDLSA